MSPQLGDAWTHDLPIPGARNTGTNNRISYRHQNNKMQLLGANPPAGAGRRAPGNSPREPARWRGPGGMGDSTPNAGLPHGPGYAFLGLSPPHGSLLPWHASTFLLESSPPCLTAVSLTSTLWPLPPPGTLWGVEWVGFLLLLGTRSLGPVKGSRMPCSPLHHSAQPQACPSPCSSCVSPGPMARGALWDGGVSPRCVALGGSSPSPGPSSGCFRSCSSSLPELGGPRSADPSVGSPSSLLTSSWAQDLEEGATVGRRPRALRL